MHKLVNEDVTKDDTLENSTQILNEKERIKYKETIEKQEAEKLMVILTTDEERKKEKQEADEIMVQLLNEEERIKEREKKKKKKTGG